MPYTGPFMITQCFINDRVNLQCGQKKIRYNIRWIKPYKSDAKVEDISSKNMSGDVNIGSPVIYCCIKYKSSETRYIIG